LPARSFDDKAMGEIIGAPAMATAMAMASMSGSRADGSGLTWPDRIASDWSQ
jgi:hypothetical protein